MIDYRAIARQYGQWSDVQRLGDNFRLMFDAVINHASARSPWFQGFLKGKQPYVDYFIEVAGNPDLSGVVRPRALPLLTRFKTSAGEKAIWTTFSADQIDLNYNDPDVLLEIIDVLLFYVSQGAELIRLDAIAYLWKEIGTSCIHLPKTHAIVRLIRAIMDEIAPHVILVAETNVSHAENMSYFGNGVDEAQMIYNFAFPPLVLHAFQTGNAEALSKWASGLTLPSERVTFVNFLASHDGIGLNALRGILSESEIEDLAKRTESRGGLISYKNNADGTQSPYELNVNYFDALDDPAAGESLALKVDRFVCAHTILLTFIGVPAIYFHSMFGSRGWPAGAVQSSQNRAINRQKLQLDELQSELTDNSSLRSQVFQRLAHLLRIRASEPAFSPWGNQRVLGSQGGVFALLRQRSDTDTPVLCLYNVSAEQQEFKIDLPGTPFAAVRQWVDLITGQQVAAGKSATLSLKAYQSYWLRH